MSIDIYIYIERERDRYIDRSDVVFGILGVSWGGWGGWTARCVVRTLGRSRTNTNHRIGLRVKFGRVV